MCLVALLVSLIPVLSGYALYLVFAAVITEGSLAVQLTLPPTAQAQRAWWSNNASNNVMTRVWLEAGFRTERLKPPLGQP